MTKILVIVPCLLALSLTFVSAQVFKGVVRYKTHYDIKKGGYRPDILVKAQGNFIDFYTNGSVSRKVIRYNEKILYTTLFDSKTQTFYTKYPGTTTVAWYALDKRHQSKVVDITREKDALEILNVSCDRLVINTGDEDHKETSEFFLHPHLLVQSAYLPFLADTLDYKNYTESLVLAAIVKTNTYVKTDQAIEILHEDDLPSHLFEIPDQHLLPYGLALETPPKPRKGYSRWYSKLYSSLRYPLSAAKKGREARVLIMFTITQKGKLEDPSVLNEVDLDFEMHIKKSLSKMLIRWEAGKQDGKAVNSVMVLPIDFVMYP